MQLESSFEDDVANARASSHSEVVDASVNALSALSVSVCLYMRVCVCVCVCVFVFVCSCACIRLWLPHLLESREGFFMHGYSLHKGCVP